MFAVIRVTRVRAIGSPTVLPLLLAAGTASVHEAFAHGRYLFMSLSTASDHSRAYAILKRAVRRNAYEWLDEIEVRAGAVLTADAYVRQVLGGRYDRIATRRAVTLLPTPQPPTSCPSVRP